MVNVKFPDASGYGFEIVDDRIDPLRRRIPRDSEVARKISGPDNFPTDRIMSGATHTPAINRKFTENQIIQIFRNLSGSFKQGIYRHLLLLIEDCEINRNGVNDSTDG